MLEVMYNLKEQVDRYHAELPGIVRALLVDHGISETVIDRHQIGWDGTCIVVPILGRVGTHTLLERWDGKQVGVPVDVCKSVKLFGWDIVRQVPRRLVIAEGIHEALVFESLGISAIAASDNGLYFKKREWADALAVVPEILVALRLGAKQPRGKFMLSRAQVVDRIEAALPQAREVTWPETVGEQGGRSRVLQDAQEDL